MHRSRTHGWFGLCLLLAAACTPAGPPVTPLGRPPEGPATSPPPAAERVKIAGPEASRVTIDDMAAFPPPGPQLPFGIQVSPSGKLITYLQKDPADQKLALFAFDTATKTSKLLVRASDFTKDTKPLSREEELRRERQRQFFQGVTGYRWARRAEVALFPFAGDLFLRDEKGALTRLTETQEPELDPKICAGGDRVAFVRGRELFLVDVATRKETQLTKGAPEGVTHGQSDFNGQEEFFEPSGYWLSPSCDRVAYLEVDEREVGTVPVFGYRGGKPDLMMQRYPLTGKANPKVRVGVLDLASKKTTWLAWPDASERYFGRFEWSADGKSLFLQTVSRDQKRLALVRADAASGKTTELAVETSPTWIEHTETWLLEKSPALVWRKTVAGHDHLEVRDVRTGAPIVQLTSGDWDVDRIVAVDEERERVLFVGTKDGPLDRHLYAVSLKGGAIERLTSESGIHRVTSGAKGKVLVDVHSALDRMWKAVVRGADGAPLGELPVPVDARVKELDLRAPKLVQIKGPSGDVLHGAILEPRAMEPGRRYPVAVMVYGGPWAQTVQNVWNPRYMWNHLADRGVVVFQLDNRGSAGRGRAFEEPIYKKVLHVELVDQIAGLDYLATLPYADTTRVGIYGESYGGSMVLTALLRAPDRFHVGVAGAPVSDQRTYDTGYTERYMMTPEANPEGYEASDLTKLAGNLRGKLLLMHGMMDENVHFENTARMIEAFIAADKKFDLMIFPGERHGRHAPAARRYGVRRIVDHLTENL